MPSILASLLLADVPPRPMHKTVIELVKEDEQGQFRGVAKIDGIKLTPPVGPIGLWAGDVRLHAIGISVVPAEIDVDAIGLVIARA
jgi:hypothetical protein